MGVIDEATGEAEARSSMTNGTVVSVDGQGTNRKAEAMDGLDDDGK